MEGDDYDLWMVRGSLNHNVPRNYTIVGDKLMSDIMAKKMAL